MASSPLAIAPLLLLLLLLVDSPSAAAKTDNSLLRCLANTTKEADIRSIVYTPTAPSFSKLLAAYIRNSRFNNNPSVPKPTTILTPSTPAHVSAAVLCAKTLNLRLRIRSGGHDYDGLSYLSLDPTAPFFLLDMFNFRNITVNLQTETAWAGAGATLGELYYAIGTQSKVHAYPAGICPTVAVGGHLSGGGYGNLLRKFGLSVDHVVDAQIVDAKGAILDRKSMGEDLFWAIKGGGGASFGVILAYKINLVRVPEVVSVFRVERWIEEDNATDIFYKWHQVAYDIDSNLFIRVLVQPVTPKKKTSKGADKTIRLTFISLFLGNADSLVSLIDKEFPELGLKKEDIKEMNWLESVLYWGDLTSPKQLLDRNLAGNDIKFLKRKSDYVQTPMTKKNLKLMWKKMIELGKTGLVFNQYGGRMAEIRATETPFPHRAGNIFKIQYSVNWNDAGAELDDKYVSQIRQLYEFNAPFVSKSPRGTFVNYRDVDIGVNHHRSSKESYEEGKVYGTKYFMQNFDRLVKVKTAVDPDNFFRYEQSIPTLPA
uniref:FAD-binding PCMH-type domain-containing protein n=1 Tax=Kalanchoe fedtschenkoi TaxID=63787 RepID=A0A7N0T186_KALFE